MSQYMPNSLVKLTKNIAFASIVVLSLSACSAVTAPSANLVEQAYATSGVVTISPYHRTIFSSTDF